MAANPSKPGPMTNVYEFGPFRLDPTEGLLLRDGTPVPLMPKTFEVLRGTSSKTVAGCFRRTN